MNFLKRWMINGEQGKIFSDPAQLTVADTKDFWW